MTTILLILSLYSSHLIKQITVDLLKTPLVLPGKMSMPSFVKVCFAQSVSIMLALYIYMLDAFDILLYIYTHAYCN